MVLETKACAQAARAHAPEVAPARSWARFSESLVSWHFFKEKSSLIHYSLYAEKTRFGPKAAAGPVGNSGCHGIVRHLKGCAVSHLSIRE
jgi:hypothetical protein